MIDCTVDEHLHHVYKKSISEIMCVKNLDDKYFS